MVDETLVRSWLSELEQAIRSKRLEVTRLQQEIAADSAREAALKAVLVVGSGEENAEISLAARSSESHQTNDALVHPVQAGGVKVLQERGKPTHVSEIRSELLRRGVPIPGKASDANVIVYLSRSPVVCRVGRGLYALREWGVPEVPRRRRRSTKKRKARRSKRSAPRTD